MIKQTDKDMHGDNLEFADDAGRTVRGRALVDEDGNQAGTATNPLKTKDSVLTAGRDGVFDAQVVLDPSHHEIHAGNGFKADINTNDLKNEGDNDALHISFKTANTTKHSHLVVVGFATGAADMALIEAPSGGVAGGSNLAIYNRNRNSGNVSGILSTDDATPNKMTQDATGPTGGTELHHWKFGTGKNKIGGQTRGLEEWVLKQNTVYSIRMTTLESTIVAQLTLEEYEHASVD